MLPIPIVFHYPLPDSIQRPSFQHHESHLSKMTQTWRHDHRTHLVDKFGDVILVLTTSSRSANGLLTTTHRYRVSSACLCLTSPVFRAMIQGPWEESAGTSEAPKEIHTSDFNPRALLYVLRLMHLGPRTRGLFINVGDLSQLCDVTIVVDYYQCPDLLGPWRRVSSRGCSPDDLIKLKPMDNNILAKALFVFSVFADETSLCSTIDAIMKYARGPLETDLPIPRHFLETLERNRMSVVETLASEINQVLARWDNPSRGYSQRNTFRLHRFRSLLGASGLLRESLYVDPSCASAQDIHDFASMWSSMECSLCFECPDPVDRIDPWRISLPAMRWPHPARGQIWRFAESDVVSVGVFDSREERTRWYPVSLFSCEVPPRA